MTYYHDLITEKSWEKLKELKKDYNFVLIGGWAVYLYTKALKSKDIDFICDYKELEKLKRKYELIKNDRLKKYEIHAGEFDIDIYMPFFSDLGIPAEDLLKMTVSIEGFDVLKAEPLLILKQKAYGNRAHSAKGQKDRIDIISLLHSEIDVGVYKELLKKYNLGRYKTELAGIINQTKEVPELNLTMHSFSRFKKSILRDLA